jgi:hypothetical protein
MKTIHLQHAVVSLAFLLFSVAGFSQDVFVNAYSRYNADRTIRLEYIEHDEEHTSVYFSYLGTSNIGTYTSLYLNNFRLIDRTTKAEYRPESTDMLPTTTDGKAFFYNSGEIIPIVIKFNRLPSYVKYIDLMEADGSSVATYNFTFRNLAISPDTDDEYDLWDYKDENDAYGASIYTTYNAQIDITLNGVYVGKLDRKFNSETYDPACGEFGTLSVYYADNRTLKGSGKGKTSTGEVTWSFEFSPRDLGYLGCFRQLLK